MIRRLSRIIMMVTDAVIYFGVLLALVAYLLKIGLHITPVTFAIVLPAIALLWAVTYAGAWCSIAEKKREKFLKVFLLVDVCPGLLGVAIAVIRSL